MHEIITTAKKNEKKIEAIDKRFDRLKAENDKTFSYDKTALDNRIWNLQKKQRDISDRRDKRRERLAVQEEKEKKWSDEDAYEARTQRVRKQALRSK
jgi:hypothetical protein